MSDKLEHPSHGLKRNRLAIILGLSAFLIVATIAALLAWSYSPFSEVSRTLDMRAAYRLAQDTNNLDADLDEESDGTMTVSYRRDLLVWRWDMVTHSEDSLGEGRLDPAKTEVGLTVLGLRVK